MLQVIRENVVWDKPFESFVINGDPGCDGYNAQGVMVLEASLRVPADFHMIIGDLVFTGRERYYAEFIDLVNASAKAPVYCLPGNHDLPDYERYLGKRDYYIAAPNAALINLDNSRRYFSDDTIGFLSRTLEELNHETVFVLFHIPVPNPVVPNHVSDDEWKKLKAALDPHKSRIQALICGHVHSGFEVNLDGYRVMVTGGGGSFLDPVENTFFERNAHHAIQIQFDGNAWRRDVIRLDHRDIPNAFPETDQGRLVAENLMEGFTGEAAAYRKYLLFAQFAEAEGLRGIAKLFRAASDSEFHHSQNMYWASSEEKSTLRNLELAIAREREEKERLYPEFIQNAVGLDSRRAQNAFDRALVAERVHHRLFTEALEKSRAGEDIPEQRYFTCKRCGFTHAGDAPPSACPACGADRFKFQEVE